MAPSQSLVELRLFGQAAIAVNGVPVKLAKRATTLSLLGYLVLHRNTPISRTSLAYTLFADENEETALAELRRYLYLTARALPQRNGESWIRADGETVQWNADAPWQVDVIDFERDVVNPQTRAQAVGLYGGDLLEELYDDWVLGERERLRGMCLDALAHLVAQHREAREHARALAYAHALIRLDPWREDIVRAAMSVRYEAGDSAGALAEFTAFTARLREEMDVAPMPETLAVRDAIARNEPLPGAVLQRSAAPSEARNRPEHLLPFVGRDRELETLRKLWDRAARGHGGFALVTGEAGIGKTRLVGELAKIVESEGGRVFIGATSVPESAPYQPVVEALRSALQLLRTRSFSPLAVAALSRVLPELHPLAVPSESGEGPTGDAAAVLDAIANAALELSRPRPALLVLEDLHWAGRATLDVIAALVRRLERTGLLVLGTFRDEEVGPDHALRSLIRELRAEQSVVTVPLHTLDRNAIEEIVDRLPAIAPKADEAFVDHLLAHTEGNALFLHEAIAEAIEGKSAKSLQLATSSRGIASTIARRVARLSDGAREVAEVVAVAGHGCNLEVVGEVVSMTPSTLWTALNELLDRRILREASVRTGMDFAFAHHLIGETVYAGIESTVRKRRHARIAHVLARLYAQRPTAVARELALHFSRADLLDDAARWFAEAARASAALHAPGEAIALATQALEIERDEVRRIALLQLREEARGRTGDRDGQRADIEELERLSVGADVAARFDVLRRRALLARSLGEAEEEDRLIEQMAALAESANDARLRAEALRQRAAHAVHVGRQMEALEPANAALALFERLGDVAAQVECLGMLADAQTNVGNLAQARTHLDAMGQRSATLEDRAVHARALTATGTAALLRQEYETSQAIAREVLDIASAIGDRDMEAFARARIAVTAAWLGDFEQALHEFDYSLQMFASLGNKRGLAITLTNNSLLAMRLGLFDDARAMIERSSELFQVVKERRMAVVNAVNASFIQLRLGNAEAALEWARWALGEARAIGFPVFEAAALANIGNAERALGRLDEAIVNMEAGIAIRRSVQAAPDFADDLSDLTIALVEGGRADEARAIAEELAALMQRPTTGPFWPHYVLWAVSRGFAASGEAGRSAEYERRAHDELQRFVASIGSEEIRRGVLAIDVSRAILGAHAARTGEA